MHVQLNLVYPLICTDRLAESRDFYHRHFGFDVVFEADWYVHMERRDADGGAHQIAFILPDHETLPPAYRRLTAGLVVSGTTADGRLVEMVELKDHPWFVASQFHPEFKSRPTRPAPLFRDFVGAATRLRIEREDELEETCAER